MAPPLLSCEAVSKAHGTTQLLDGVTLGVTEGERIGVVGRNGGGKSTLVKVLAGVEEPDGGRVVRTGGATVELFRQDVVLPRGASVRDVVMGDTAVHEWAGDAGVRDVLDGLGLPGLGLDSPVDPMSGGERRRVALAALLARPGDAAPDLLVLDEPTNHLDVEGVDWLARHLVARRGGLVVVTHDRWFLDAVCSTTWEVQGGQVHAYDGGYAAYVLARAERARIAAASEARRQNLLRKELAWLRRGPPARTSKPRFRIEAAQALIADEPPPRDRTALQAFATARLGKRVFDLEDVSVRVGDRTLFEHVTWRLGPGDRLGIVGVNGAGKTTLLRLLLAERQPDAGRVEVGKTVKVAHLSQEVAELDPGLRVLEAVEEIARVITIGGKEQTATQLLEQFGFAGSGDAWKRVGDLSGGERRRLQLLRLLMTEPNVLLLDEPTNDLDVDVLTALEDLLDGWPGTLVVVSHDRYFLERTTDRTVALLGDGRLAELPGGVEEYLERRRAVASSAPTVAGTRAKVGDSRAARKELARLERALDKLTTREDRLHAQMAEAATDHARLRELDGELRAVQAEKADTEEAWLVLADEV
ncbi:MAG: ABC-F family ATP-binding cassette domain-containing protein [Actinomycetota bacterium]|nr:ABC-F family ATP-binding cassette domain-containing protein [Actinomycetota bacterium]